MNKTQSDLIEWYKLETKFFLDHIRHTIYVGKAKNRNEKVEEDWRNCGELGRGGFGVVHKQIQKTTGHYRAVKAIDKRLPQELDYSRELLVMAILAKVCVFTPRDYPRFPAYYPMGFSCCGLMVTCLSAHLSLWSFWDGSRSPRLCILQ